MNAPLTPSCGGGGGGRAGVSNDWCIIVLSAIGRCYTRRNLNRFYSFMEITVPSYLPDEFKSHFRMTRETRELFTQEAMRTGRIPLGNTSGRPAIPPAKQVLAF